jgi:ferredoxin
LRRVDASPIPPLREDDPPPAMSPVDASQRHELLRRAATEPLLESAARLAAANIRPDRLTCPDLIGQLRFAAARPPEIAACVVLDPDPTTDLQAGVARDQADAFWLGVDWLGRGVAPRRRWVVHDRSDPLPPSDPTRARPRPCENIYPLSEPTVLCLELFGRRLPPGSLPVAAGVLLFDAVTAVAVGRLIAGDLAFTHAPATFVDGDRVHLRHVPAGTTLKRFVESVDDRLAESRFWQDAALRQTVADPAQGIGNGSLWFGVASHEPRPAASCVRCGWCLDVCPTRCTPAALLDCAQRHDVDLARRFGVDACVGCGLCDAACPSSLPLLEAIRRLKAGGASR